jgi:hypothetical protein
VERCRILKKIDTAICDDIVMVLIGVSSCCVYGKGTDILFIKQNICNISHGSLYVWLRILNCSLINININLNISYLYYRHTMVTDTFLLPIRIAICLLLTIILLRCMQLSVSPLFPALILFHCVFCIEVIFYSKLVDK